MSAFQGLEYAAWGISALLALWMVYDMIKTDRSYSEEFLTSSKEGEIRDALVIDPTHQGGRQ